MPDNLTRRHFALLTASPLLAVPTPAAPPDTPLTANEVIARIKSHVGVPWQDKTVDTFKSGNPDTTVRGIATTVMSTADVLKKAGAANKNLIITHEPTFYNHPDDTKIFEADPVYLAKQQLIREHDLVVWRFHDHWHRRQPDGILTGIVRTLGWGSYQQPQDTTDNTGVYQGRQYFIIPQISLNNLALSMQTKLGNRLTRVIGNPQASVTKVAVEVGYASLEPAIKTLERKDVEVLVVGETREWETVEYVKDAVTLGENKGLIILGHVTSEDPGMQECARWLKTFIPEVPIEWIPAGEPFWQPT